MVRTNQWQLRCFQVTGKYEVFRFVTAGRLCMKEFRDSLCGRLENLSVVGGRRTLLRYWEEEFKAYEN
jgi:hypothetical protein